MKVLQKYFFFIKSEKQFNKQLIQPSAVLQLYVNKLGIEFEKIIELLKHTFSNQQYPW